MEKKSIRKIDKRKGLEKKLSLLAKIISFYQENKDKYLTRKQLSEEMNMKDSNLSKYLKYLKNKGIIILKSEYIDKKHRKKCILLNPNSQGLIKFIETYYFYSKTQKIIKNFLISLPEGIYKRNLSWFLSTKEEIKQYKKVQNNEFKEKIDFIFNLMSWIQKTLTKYVFMKKIGEFTDKRKVKILFSNQLKMLNDCITELYLQDLTECQKYILNILIFQIEKLINSSPLLTELAVENKLFGFI